jgi:hypothetical protein
MVIRPPPQAPRVGSSVAMLSPWSADDPAVIVTGLTACTHRSPCGHGSTIGRGMPRGLPGLGILTGMGPSRSEILGAAALVGVLVLLMLVLVWWAIPPGGPPALQ